MQVKRPECMREQICRELLDKDSVVDPDEMELRFFGQGNRSAADDLVMEW